MHVHACAGGRWRRRRRQGFHWYTYVDVGCEEAKNFLVLGVAPNNAVRHRLPAECGGGPLVGVGGVCCSAAGAQQQERSTPPAGPSAPTHTQPHRATGGAGRLCRRVFARPCRHPDRARARAGTRTFWVCVLQAELLPHGLVHLCVRVTAGPVVQAPPLVAGRGHARWRGRGGGGGGLAPTVLARARLAPARGDGRPAG